MILQKILSERNGIQIMFKKLYFSSILCNLTFFKTMASTYCFSFATVRKFPKEFEIFFGKKKVLGAHGTVYRIVRYRNCASQLLCSRSTNRQIDIQEFMHSILSLHKLTHSHMATHINSSQCLPNPILDKSQRHSHSYLQIFVHSKCIQD